MCVNLYIEDIVAKGSKTMMLKTCLQVTGKKKVMKLTSRTSRCTWFYYFETRTAVVNKIPFVYFQAASQGSLDEAGTSV